MKPSQFTVYLREIVNARKKISSLVKEKTASKLSSLFLLPIKKNVLPQQLTVFNTPIVTYLLLSHRYGSKHKKLYSSRYERDINSAHMCHTAQGQACNEVARAHGDASPKDW